MALYASAAGRALFGLRMCLPKAGAWHADVSVEGEEPLPQAVDVVLGGVTFKASVRRQGLAIGNVYARLVAGSAGFNREVPAQGYLNAPFRVPLQDILTAAGERLSPASSGQVTSFLLNSWSRPQGFAGQALANLVDASPLRATWRVLLDGSVWVGPDAWPKASVDYEELVVDPELGRLEVYAQKPEFQPGTLVNGLRISYVEHVLRESRLRTWVWTE